MSPTRLRENYQYYRNGFADAVWEQVRWLHHPPVWWGWFIAAPLWIFNLHIVMAYQIAQKWQPEDRFNGEPGWWLQ